MVDRIDQVKQAPSPPGLSAGLLLCATMASRPNSLFARKPLDVKMHDYLSCTGNAFSALVQLQSFRVRSLSGAAWPVTPYW